MLKFSIYDVDLQKLLSMALTSISSSDSKKKLICINIKKDFSYIMSETQEISSLIKFSPHSIESEGFIIINGLDFHNLIKQFNSELITISVIQKSEHTSISLTSDSTQVELSTEMELDSPFVFQDLDLKYYFKINSKILLNNIKKVYFCSSSDLNKVFLNSILFDFNADKKLSLVSTDGKRLAISDQEIVESNIDSKLSFLLPKKFIDHLISILSNFDADTYIHLSERFGLFKINNISIKVQLLDLKFPDYKSVIPNNDKILDIQKNDILYQLKKVLAIDKNSILLGVNLIIDKGLLKIESSSGINNIKIRIPCSFSDSELFSITCHVKLLSEIINYIESDSIRILLKDKNSPIVIKSLSNESHSSYILAPIVT